MDETMFIKFIKKYEKAKKDKKELFIFEGKEVLVTYATYLVEYINSAFYKKYVKRKNKS